MNTEDSEFIEMFDMLSPILSLGVFGLVVLFVNTFLVPETRLEKTDPVQVEPMYFHEGEIVKSYPNTANTHILKKGGEIFVVFQMDTEYRPITMTSKLSGVCE